MNEGASGGRSRAIRVDLHHTLIAQFSRVFLGGFAAWNTVLDTVFGNALFNTVFCDAMFASTNQQSPSVEALPELAIC
jgi:hypothetical protein